MPHTMNGKCDRKRLPAPEWRAPPHPAAETEAATGSASPFEALVTAVWRDALGLASIARDRSFLSLGGHSLLATRVIARLREATGKALSLAEFFEQPTIAGCAQQLAIAPVAAGAITRILAGEEAPLTAAQKQMWFMARLDPDDTSYNQPCLIRIAGGIEPERLRRALASVICAQPALRIRIVERDGESAQRVAAEVELDLPCIEFDAVDLDAALRAQGLLLAAAPFALDTAPLLRAQLCKVGEEDWVLLLVVHHLVFDEWSLSILVQQLAAAYVEEREPATPALRFIDDCADRQGRDWSDALDALEREFADVPPSLALPTDRPRGLHLDTAGGGLNVVLDEALSRSLSALAADAGVTEYMLLLAVFQLLLHETSGQSCFLTLTAASGRDAVGSEEVIGCYINMVPLRADVVAGERFPELLARVRSRCLAALERQRLPLEQLVARLPRTPGLPQSAFGQVAFGLQNAPSAEAQVAGIRFSGCEIRNVAARLDLSVWIDVRSGPLRVEWTYRNDLFEPSTIAGLQQRYRELLQAVAASPESDVAALLRNGKQGFIDTNAPGKPLPSKLSAKLVPKTFGRRDSASLERDWLGQALPSRVVATLDGVDVAEWAAAHRPLIDEQLSTVGGLLMRGFRVDSVNDFRAFAQAVSSELIHYSERSSPRTEVTDGIYTSTDHPQDQPIVLHNEQSYTLNWPMRIGFYCARPALQRGRTPIADSRRILARLAPATVERFERLGVMYVRNFHDGISLPWTVAFQTDDRRQVEAYCRSVSVDVEWIDGDRLRTRQVRPAIRVHPCIDERTWFNHALFFHVTSLPEEITRSLRASMAEEHLPYNTYYGDGSPIADETLAELRAAFDAETVSFNWRRGDVLLLDNMLVAHGREPFVGPREVRAVMLDPYLSLRAASPLPAQAKERPA
jgi:alpha-ketoglutarate-dependent taurine dioxygenase